MTSMLYKQIEENQTLHKKLEQNQQQHTMFLTKLLLSQQQNDQNSHMSEGIQNCMLGQFGGLDNQLGQGALSGQNDFNPVQSQLMNYLEEQMNPQQLLMNNLQTSTSCNSGTTNAAPAKTQSPLSQLNSLKTMMTLPNSRKFTKSPDLLN